MESSVAATLNNNADRSSFATLLQAGANPSLRYHDDELLYAYLAGRLKQSIATLPYPEQVTRVVQSLIADIDYRFAAEYLHAMHTGDAQVSEAFERLVSNCSVRERNLLLYDIARVRFSQTSTLDRAGPVLFVEHLEEVFSRSESGLIVYLSEEKFKPVLRTLLDDVGTAVGSFIEQQHDLPSRLALVRSGIVKKWGLPNGKTIVSKRENPHKPGRFRNEQFIYETLRWLQVPLLLGRTATGGGVWLKLSPPFAIIRDEIAGHYYALSPWTDGIMLEELLIHEDDPAKRRDYLTHYRWLFDALCDRGVQWGDMSPRNILVEQTGEEIVYNIFDFEKSQVLAGSASTADRIVQCRGQICVEELGIICTPQEVEECFEGYFEPKAWELESDAVLPFAQRPEVASVLVGRGVSEPPLGLYNRTDLEIRSVRRPDVDPLTDRDRFPGQLNFKIEHYLSCGNYDDAGDYDRKTTEVLIAAKRHGCFDAVVDVLTRLTNWVEGAFVQAEFESLIKAGRVSLVIPSEEAIGSLVRTIDTLYESRESPDDFLTSCDLLSLAGSQTD